MSKIVLGFDWGYIREGPRAKRFIGECKRGIQRFRYGYDDAMFKNFCDYLDLLIIEDLRYMITKGQESPDLNKEELKEMLHHFEQSNHEQALEMLKKYYIHLWN
jgi:hypothetical protein